MKTKLFGDNIICFTADTQKELTLTFFRVQEFYESQKPALFRKAFDAYTFLTEMMDDEGNINYFSEWDGFNIPSHIFSAWMHSTVYEDRSMYEEEMIDQIFKKLDTAKLFYVIGVRKGDEDTLKHEICHALYYTDTQFKQEADNLVSVFASTYPKLYDQFRQDLLNMGYAADVVQDELVAWLSSSTESDIEYNFCDTYADLKPTITLFRKLLQKYNIHS
jgi:hypothetical protein